MKKVKVYYKGRVRTLKEGVTFDYFQAKYPEAVKVCRVPSIRTLEEWSNDCGCEAIDGCWVEPDGTCQHGQPSWLLAMGMI